MCTSAVVISPSSNILLTNPDLSSTPPLNTSLPTNQTIPPPPKILPPSPYVYTIPDAASLTTVTFSTYTRPMTEVAALECLVFASEDVESALEAAVLEGRPDPVMRQQYVRKEAAHATLVVSSVEGRLKWITWSQTLKALTQFLYSWEIVGFGFVIEVEGVRVAVGGLAAM